MVATGAILGGKYQVERVLGQGGMGTVVAARHLHLDQRVAIKVLNPDLVDQPVIVERFLREARAAVRLRSDHVGRVFDAGRFDDGTPYLVMEYLEGRDLAQELRAHHQLPVPTAVDYILQACEALSEAHQAGIVHRDLKPANLFVTTGARGAPLVKVLDFGISKLVDDPASDLTRTKVVMGSPSYMSPEQLRATRDVDARADVWSLGVVLYQLVSGRLPFVGVSLTDLALKISSDPPAPLEVSVPPGFEAAIARCFAKQPDARYASVAAFAQALAPFAQHGHYTTLSAATGSFGHAAAPPRSRSRALVIGGVAFAVIAIALGTAIAVWPGGDAHPAAPAAAAPASLTPPAAATAPPSTPTTAPVATAPADAGLAAPADASPPVAAKPVAPKPAPTRPSATRPPARPHAGSAAPVDDLTRSQY